MLMLQIGVIPARYQSVRFPGKPLVKILGVPMVVRTWQQACLCKTMSKVIVATDDERIAEACRQEGAEVVMTSVSCANGTAAASPSSCLHTSFTPRNYAFSSPSVLPHMCRLFSLVPQHAELEAR